MQKTGRVRWSKEALTDLNSTLLRVIFTNSIPKTLPNVFWHQFLELCRSNRTHS